MQPEGNRIHVWYLTIITAVFQKLFGHHLRVYENKKRLTYNNTQQKKTFLKLDRR